MNGALLVWPGVWALIAATFVILALWSWLAFTAIDWLCRWTARRRS